VRRRAQVLAAAGRLLGEPGGLAGFSLEAVAKAAGVTRLTVYNQFGSRRGLLEAVLDARAEAGGLARIPQAMAQADPLSGLDQLVEIFCDFWSQDTAAARLQSVGAFDPEFGEAVAARNARRRTAIATLLRRITGAEPSADAVDMIFGLTSQAMHQALSEGRTPQALTDLVRRATRLALTL